MRRESTQEQSTDLIVKENLDIVKLYNDPEKVDDILNGIKEKAKQHIPDLSTDKTRKEIASNARKVASSKTFLDAEGKKLVAKIKEQSKLIDSERKRIRDTLDELRDKVRKPLTDWEAEQKLEAQKMLDWDEAIEENNRIEREKELARREAELKAKEEEIRKREEAERLEKERTEREKRLKKEAAEQAKLEAERKAEAEKEEIRKREIQAKLAAEKAEREKIEHEELFKAEAIRVELEKKEALERAEREKQEAIKQEKKRAEKEAKRKEAERLENERIERERLEKLAANTKHRKSINLAALSNLMEVLKIDESLGKEIIKAIASGKISHITINY